VGRPTKKQQEAMDEKANDLIPKLAGIGCTHEEIATVTGIDRSTIIRKYNHLFHKGRNNLKMTLRREALHRATKGGSDSILRKLLEQYIPDMKEETNININQSQLEDIKDEELVEIMLASKGKVEPIKNG